MTIRAGLTALFVLGAATSAFAQVTAEQQSAIRSNCRSDFISKCSGVTPGGKEALECLQKNVDGLSAACRTAVSATLPRPATASAPAASPWPAPAASAPSSPWPAPASAAQPAAPAPPATASAPPPAKPAAPTTAAPKAPAKPKAAVAAKPAAPKAKTAAAPPPAPAAPVLMPTTEQAAAIKFTCSHDVKSFCADAAGGGAEGFACLQRNSEKLSPDCRTSVAAVEENAAEAPEQPAGAAAAGAMPKAPAANAVVTLRACRRDLVKHCKDVQPGGGRELACLATHENELTVRCKMARRASAPIR